MECWTLTSRIDERLPGLQHGGRIPLFQCVFILFLSPCSGEQVDPVPVLEPDLGAGAAADAPAAELRLEEPQVRWPEPPNAQAQEAGMEDFAYLYHTCTMLV